MISIILIYLHYVWHIFMVSFGFIVSFACFINLSSFSILTVKDSFIFVLIREFMETLATFLYLPAFLVNSIGLLVSFGTVLHVSLSSAEVATFTENFILARYTASTRRSHLPKYRTPSKFSPSICFMGGGQLWMFAIGVGHYVYENFDITHVKFLASSCGTFAAVPLACGLDPYDWCRKDWAKCITHFNSRSIFGCLCDSKYFYYNLWNEYLPDDAHIKCSGKLFISVTLFPSLKNRVISQFNTRDDLIWAIVGSICVPFVFIRDFPVKCADDVGYVIDGGFSNDSPCLDSYTITVSALHQEADIRPLTTQPFSSSSHSEMPNNNHHTTKNNKHHRSHREPKVHKKEEQEQQKEEDIILTNIDNNLNNDHNNNISISFIIKDNIEFTSPRRSSRINSEKKQQNISITSSSLVESNLDSNISNIKSIVIQESVYSSKSNNTNQRLSNTTTTTLVRNNTSTTTTANINLLHMSKELETNASYRHKIRIRSFDIIRVPKYDRVWEVGSLGLEAAANCIDFNRHEWSSIRINQKS